MPTDLSAFVDDLDPETTVLFLGAGSSQPSKAPSTLEIIGHLAKTYRQSPGSLTLAELTDLIEQKTKDRKRMISEVRSLFTKASPSGGLVDLPRYNWKAIYTTNYDELVEVSYTRANQELVTYSSNFDFGIRGRSNAARLYKLHGTLSRDIVDGWTYRLIVTETDYSFTEDYRQKLYDTFRADLAESNLIIIGHSLADPDIKEVIARAITLNAEAMSGGRITLLMYERDEDRATLHEAKGLRVVFASIDDFFAKLAQRKLPQGQPTPAPGQPLSALPALTISTLDVTSDLKQRPADVSRMFNGWSATYSDIEYGLTFERSVTENISDFVLSGGLYATLVGASGVGKTTAARQVLLRLRNEGYLAWEHNLDSELEIKDWISVARDLQESGRNSVLFVDDAHIHLHEINELVERLAADGLSALRLILASGRNNWLPRSKTPSLFRLGKEFHLSRLNNEEINKLLTLVDAKEEIRRLVEDTFAGFSRDERRRRLIERCEADMFVCMKNIFSTEAYDDIVLREYNDLEGKYQAIYRLVAALENSGVRVHRQLAIRLLNIPADAVGNVLDHLTDIVSEYTIDDKKHIYGWMGRHPVISAIITRYKFAEIEPLIELYDKVIDNIIPTYDIEIRSIRELCSVDTGIARIPDKKAQNRLLRKMSSVAPGERVPRHRLIRNLLDMDQFEQAQTEIRIFEKDFGADGPVARYRINLLVARATRTPGIMTEDRLVILEQARELALTTIKRFEHTPRVFAAYCEVGLEIYRLSGRLDVFDDAMSKLKEAEERIGDPEVTLLVRRYEHRIMGQSVSEDRSEA